MFFPHLLTLHQQKTTKKSLSKSTCTILSVDKYIHTFIETQYLYWTIKTESAREYKYLLLILKSNHKISKKNFSSQLITHHTGVKPKLVLLLLFFNFGRWCFAGISFYCWSLIEIFYKLVALIVFTLCLYMQNEFCERTLLPAVEFSFVCYLFLLFFVMVFVFCIEVFITNFLRFCFSYNKNANIKWALIMKERKRELSKLCIYLASVLLLCLLIWLKCFLFWRFFNTTGIRLRFKCLIKS